MKTRSFVTDFLALLSLLGSPLCSRATTLVVTSLADSGSGTLRAAIGYASSGDTITFATNGVITLTGGTLVIPNNLTITGPGTANLTINGLHNFTIFEIPTSAVTLDSLTLTNGNGGLAGAILVGAGGKLTVNNCTVISNTTTAAGGGIDISGGGTVTLNNSTLSGNSSTSRSVGGGGGGIANSGTLTINNSMISGNSSASEVGGGILNSGTLTVNNSTLSGNSAAYEGGGIFNDVPGTLNVNQSTLINNGVADDSGGAINNNGTVTINESILADNTAARAGGGISSGGVINLNQITLANNTANQDGGGIHSGLHGAVNIVNSTLSGNYAPLGGGIHQDGSSAATIVNSTLSANSAVIGGGIYQDQSSTFVFTNTIVAGNAANSNSPDIYGQIEQFTLVNSLTSGDPLLAPLGDYGGPTQTMPPLAGSPAIDYGDDSVTNFLTTDQRGYPRLSGAHVDIGAVEAQYAPANNPPQLMNAISSGLGGNSSFQFAFTNVPDADFTALASTNLTLPLADWTVLGNIPEISSGQYQFTDPGATNYPQRFYQVVSP